MATELLVEAKKRQKAFEGRADTLLKLTRELSTLCDSPACVVVYNPDDVIRPWRIWPDTEAEFRSVIQLYKNQPQSGRRRNPKSAIVTSGSGSGNRLTAEKNPRPPEHVSAGKEKPLAGIWEDQRAEAAVDVIAIHSESTIAVTSGNVTDDAFDDDGLLLEWDDCQLFELDELFNSSDREEEVASSNAHSDSSPNAPNTTTSTCASAVCDYEYDEPTDNHKDATTATSDAYTSQQSHKNEDTAVISAAASITYDDVGINSNSVATSCGDQTFDDDYVMLLLREWDDSKRFDLDELLISSHKEEDAASDTPTNETCTSVAISGNKRKSRPDEVYSFSDLMMPASSQRRKIIV